MSRLPSVREQVRDIRVAAEHRAKRAPRAECDVLMRMRDEYWRSEDALAKAEDIWREFCGLPLDRDQNIGENAGMAKKSAAKKPKAKAKAKGAKKAKTTRRNTSTAKSEE